MGVLVMLYLSIYMETKKAGSSRRDQLMLPLSITESRQSYNCPNRGLMGRASGGQADARGRAFAHNLPAEAELFGRPATRFARQAARTLHQPLGFDQTPEILLMEADARERFNGALQ